MLTLNPEKLVRGVLYYYMYSYAAYTHLFCNPTKTDPYHYIFMIRNLTLALYVL